MGKVSTAISKKLGLQEQQVEQVLDALRFHVVEALNKGEEVRLQDFVIFGFKDLEERQRKNPKTKETVIKDAARFPKVRFSTVFKNLLHPPAQTSKAKGQTEISEPPVGSVEIIEPEVIPYPAPDVPEPTIAQPPVIATLPVVPPPFPEAATVPPPLPEPEKQYHLTNQSVCPESQARKLPPDTLIWHPDFGAAWKKVSEVFH